MNEAKKAAARRMHSAPEAMSATEIDVAIAELQRLQSKPVSRRSSILGGSFVIDVGARRSRKNFWPVAGWAQDAANLRGDCGRIGRDMWIGMLQNAKVAKRS